MEAYSRGTALAKQAIDADLKGEYTRAYPLYINCINCLLLALKTVKEENIRSRLAPRIEGYMVRAEVLKRHLAGERPDPPSDSTSPPPVILENVTWDDIVGLDGAKRVLQRAAILPQRFPGIFAPPQGGILLYGPPGTGKTLLARAVASGQGASFFSVSVADIVSKYLGEAERNLREVFERARATRPAVIFIDEVEVLCAKRDEGHDAMNRVTAEFLAQMDGVGKSMEGVVLLGATNAPWEVDAAMRRRFTKRIYIPLPGKPAREAFLRKHPELEGVREEELEGFSGADMAVLLAEVRFAPLKRLQEYKQFREGPDGLFDPIEEGEVGEGPTLLEIPPGKLRPPPPPSPEDAREALRGARPSSAPEDLERYEQWTARYGERGE